jgi:ribosomal-protein-serine acetyltransferase
VDRTQSADDVRLFIDEVVTPQWADNRGPQCGIWIDGALAGSVGCHPIDWANRGCSIGYWIESRRQGQGIVTRSVAGMLDYLFDEMRLHRVVIQCGVGNRRSCAVPARLGFTKEGVLRQAERVNDRWLDLATWIILEDEWRRRRRR